ncbi:MAG: sigma-70 family RNA polymerase sigma factor [Candidatus Thiodiazotropha sp.]
MPNYDETRKTSASVSDTRLSVEQEEVLLEKALNHNDKVARDELIKSHIYLVKAIARDLNYSHLPMDDLIQAGVWGLLDALKKYEISKGYRFSTFASWHVKGRILDAIEEIKPSGIISYDDPLLNGSEESGQRKDMLEDPHYVPVDVQYFMHWLKTATSNELFTIADFIEGSLSDPFERRNIGNALLNAGSGLQMRAEIQGSGVSLFSTSDPFERRNLFKRLLSLRTEL